MAQPASSFDDPRVQVVYDILCADDKPPAGEHWEGFVARRIVDALAAPQQAAPAEPVADGLPLVVAGAIFDFAGYLTTRKHVIEVGATANASPMADLVKEWAKLRGLSLADAAVLSWHEWLHAAAPQQAAIKGDKA